MDPSFHASFAKAQQLRGVSLSSFIATISTSAFIFLIQAAIFLALRTKVPDIYCRDTLTSAVPNFSDVIHFRHGSETFDRYLFRRYIRTILLIFAPAALLITPILVPLNYHHGKAAGSGVTGLDTLGWSNVGLEHCDRYWAHLVASVFFIGYVCFMIWHELTYYIEARQRFHTQGRSTILIDSIPQEWRTKERLAAQLDCFPGNICRISFNRDFRPLLRLIEDRNRLLHTLERIYTESIREELSTHAIGTSERPQESSSFSRFMKGTARRFYPIRSSNSQDRLSCHRELATITSQIQHYCTNLEGNSALYSAFVTFDCPLAAHMACQTVMHPHPGYMTPRILVNDEEDVIWDNVCISWWSRNVRTVLSNLTIISLGLLCVVPAAFAGLLSQIIYLTKAFSWLEWLSDLPEWSLGVLQGLLPPLILAVLLKVFSTGLEFLVEKQGIVTKSLVSLRIQDFYFSFLFVQITLIVSLSAGLTTLANEVVSGAAVVSTMAKNLPKASNYFLSYVLIQALSVSASSLLRIDRLFGKFVLGMFDRTVTEMQVRQKVTIQLGTFVPIYTNLACVGFVYAIISPIILPFQTLIFALFWVIYAESTVFPSRQDTGGMFYPKALKHLLFGIYLMEISLTALFLLVRDQRGNVQCIGQASLMVVVIALTAVYQHLLQKAFTPVLHFAPPCLDYPTLNQPMHPFLLVHESLTATPVMRIPRDEQGIAEKVASGSGAPAGYVIRYDDANIGPSGKIVLTGDRG